MGESLFGLAIDPGKEDAYRELGRLARERRDEFGAARRRFGVIRHASWLVRSAEQVWAVVFVASPDLAGVARHARDSDNEFDVTWRETVRGLWGEQAWDRNAVAVVDVGHDDPTDVVQFLASIRPLAPGEVLPETDECASLGLSRLLVTVQDGMVLTYASGDVGGAYELAAGGPLEPLVSSLYRMPLPEPVIAWSAD